MPTVENRIYMYIFVQVYGKIRNCLWKLIVEACTINNVRYIIRILCVECNVLFTLYCYSVVPLLQPAYGLLIVRYGYIDVRCLRFTIMLCYGIVCSKQYISY